MPPKKKFARSKRSEYCGDKKKNSTDESKDEKSIQDKKGASKDEESLLQKSKSVKVADKDEQKKLIFEFVKKTFELGPKGLKDQFAGMKRGNDFEKMKVFMENNTKGRNRYKDVGCLDATRVKLANFGDNDYIHANYVKTPTSDKRFICCQAPLEKTCPDFWCMILQESVENIVMLCNLTEKGAKKCHEYFPTETDEEAKFGDYTVKCLGRKSFKFKESTSAEVKVTSLEVECDGKSQKLKQYHWVDWPDRGVPQADLAIIELLQAIRDTKTPIAVHCSAGIGRTGSVVLIQYILEMVMTGQQVSDCAELLKELRSQRNNSVQTDHQYLFVHAVLINYWVSQDLLDKTVKTLVERFQKGYKALVIEK